MGPGGNFRRSLPIRISVTEVLRNIADYINRVAYRGERFVLVRAGQPVAELSPVPMGTRLEDLPALLKLLASLTDEDADSLATELDGAPRSLDGEPPRDPWAS